MKTKRVASRKYRLITPAFALTLTSVLALALSAQEIKKGTQLISPKDGVALMAAEAKRVSGVGNSSGGSLPKAAQGMAGAYNQSKLGMPPLPDDPPDPDHDYNEDPTMASNLSPRSLCHVNTRDKVVVIGKDGERILVEVRDKRYGGPQMYPSLAPTLSGDSLEYSDAGVTPACLNKTKLWIDHDVFEALSSVPVPPDPTKARKQQVNEDKAALRSASEGN
jgi:hypothetical protein